MDTRAGKYSGMIPGSMGKRMVHRGKKPVHGGFLGTIWRFFGQKFTVMLIPHSEKKTCQSAYQSACTIGCFSIVYWFIGWIFLVLTGFFR